MCKFTIGRWLFSDVLDPVPSTQPSILKSELSKVSTWRWRAARSRTLDTQLASLDVTHDSSSSWRRRRRTGSGTAQRRSSDEATTVQTRRRDGGVVVEGTRQRHWRRLNPSLKKMKQTCFSAKRCVSKTQSHKTAFAFGAWRLAFGVWLLTYFPKTIYMCKGKNPRDILSFCLSLQTFLKTCLSLSEL